MVLITLQEVVVVVLIKELELLEAMEEEALAVDLVRYLMLVAVLLTLVVVEVVVLVLVLVLLVVAGRV